MAGYSARQSTYVDTDTILAAHSNDEFNAILAAFHLTTGHKHDGSTAGDGPLLVITGALNSGSITSGFGNINTGSSTITTTGAITGGSVVVDNLSINTNTITATSGAVNIIPASGSAILLDGTISVDAGVVTGATSITSTAFVGTLSTAAQANITSVGTLTGLTISGALIKSVTNSITAGSTQSQAGATALTTDINRVVTVGTNGDGVKLPTAVAGAKVEIINDDAAQTIQIWPATGDAIDGGSANAVDANTLAAGSDRTYFSVDATNWYTKSSDELAASATVAGIVELATTAEVNTGSDDTRAITPAGLTAWTGDTALVTTGALDAGSITSNFGTIDTGSSAITTTGLISGGSLDIDNVLINGTTIGHTDDTDLMTVADGALTVDGTITVGVDDAGHDVKFFGHAAGAYMEYDASADQLRIMGASADAVTSTGKLLLATSLTDVNNLDVIGKIDFQAPHEAGGTDAITVAASIQAMAQDTFSGTVNATDLLFFTGHSEAATEKFRFTSQGEIGVGGANYGTDGQVLTSAGAGAAVAWESASGGLASGDIIGADDGSVSAPGLTFADDLNNGFYRIGTDNWAAAAAGAKVWEVSAAGEVTTPLNPAFDAYHGGDTLNQFGNDVVYTPKFGSTAEDYDRNSDFNTGTYTFTAPVTGIYYFSCNMSIYGLVSGHGRTYMNVVTSNGAGVLWQALPLPIVFDTTITLTGGCSRDMDAADTAYISVKVFGGAQVVDYTNSTFTGALIG